jgi:hypothetical protein
VQVEIEAHGFGILRKNNSSRVRSAGPIAT